MGELKLFKNFKNVNQISSKKTLFGSNKEMPNW